MEVKTRQYQMIKSPCRRPQPAPLRGQRRLSDTVRPEARRQNLSCALTFLQTQPFGFKSNSRLPRSSVRHQCGPDLAAALARCLTPCSHMTLRWPRAHLLVAMAFLTLAGTALYPKVHSSSAGHTFRASPPQHVRMAHSHSVGQRRSRGKETRTTNSHLVDGFALSVCSGGHVRENTYKSGQYRFVHRMAAEG
jgi:hypothetical protein